MKEITIGVYQRYSHRGKAVKHRLSTKRQWYREFINEMGKFEVKRINFFQIPYYKSRIYKKIKVWCVKCSQEGICYIRKEGDLGTIQCYNGCEMPSLVTWDGLVDLLHATDSDMS